jgi:hypothetical protein
MRRIDIKKDAHITLTHIFQRTKIILVYNLYLNIIIHWVTIVTI